MSNSKVFDNKKVYKVEVYGVVHRVVILGELDKDWVRVEVLDDEPFKIDERGDAWYAYKGTVKKDRLVPEGGEK